VAAPKPCGSRVHQLDPSNRRATDARLLDCTDERKRTRRRPARLLRTTNDSELERRDGTLAFPSEDERYPGQCSLDFS
jgi:hypothetical protein